VEVEPVIVEGNTARRILEQADAAPADLVVMGTHGTGGLQRFVMGSVAERIVRTAACPVLTVSPRASEPSPPPRPIYDRIVCAVDLSEGSHNVFEYALKLAESRASELTVLHVLEPPSWSFLVPDRADPSKDPQLLLEARTRLESLLPANVHEHCSPRLDLRIGKAHEQILAVAQLRDAQVVVVGVRGRSAGVVEPLFLGSVTNQVVRGAACPVLSVREVRPAASRPIAAAAASASLA
jgi:nucleotide-binding universal stress UspA family protein